MSDIALYLCICVGAFSILMGACYVGYRIDKAKCNATAEAMQLEGRYTSMTGCMVRVNGLWWPIKSLGV